MDISAVRDRNARVISSLLREEGPLTRAELAQRSGLTRPTVTSIVDQLLDDGTATERRPDGGEPRPGRPSSTLRFNPGRVCVAAIRVRRATAELTLADAYGTVLGASACAVDRAPAQRFDQIATAVRALHASTPAAGALGAAVILVPGTADRGTGRITFAPYGWAEVPAAALLEEQLQVPVGLMNPAPAAALGEVSRGAGRGHTDLVTIFLDLGLGAGVVSNGRLLRTAELGHCAVPGLDGPCACGRRGCLETVASGSAILARATAVLGAPAGRSLADLEALGQPEVDAVLVQAAEHLALGASWLINLFGPTALLLGGTRFAAGATGFRQHFARALEDRNPVGELPLVALAGPQADVEGAITGALELLPAPLQPRALFSVAAEH